MNTESDLRSSEVELSKGLPSGENF